MFMVMVGNTLFNENRYAEESEFKFLLDYNHDQCLDLVIKL